MAAQQPPAKTFQGVLERRSDDRLHWTIVRIPFDAARLWGKRGQIRVKGEINGFPFCSTLFPTGNGGHMLSVNKKMQAGGKATAGGKAKFRLQPDTTPREVKPSAELMAVLRQSKQLQKFFDSLSYSIRRFLADLVAQGKHTETRRRRAEQTAEHLMETMEAERELPPLIQIAFRQNPKARAGWKLMSANRRRTHLLSTFYYRNPESRARRLAKAMEEMVAYADKRAKKQEEFPDG